MNLAKAVDFTRERWNHEAELFCCQHGRKGGEFEIVRWANGRMMAQAAGSRCNQAIPAERLEELRRANWKIGVAHEIERHFAPEGNSMFGVVNLVYTELGNKETENRFLVRIYWPAGQQDFPDVRRHATVEEARKTWVAWQAKLVGQGCKPIACVANGVTFPQAN